MLNAQLSAKADVRPSKLICPLTVVHQPLASGGRRTIGTEFALNNPEGLVRRSFEVEIVL